MREILESHPVANLKKEVGKLKKSLNYSKLNKKELIDLMMKPNLINNFKHLKMYVKPERKKPIKKEVKKEVKAKPKEESKPKAKEEPTGPIKKLYDFLFENNTYTKKFDKLRKFTKTEQFKKLGDLGRHAWWINEWGGLEAEQTSKFIKLSENVINSDIPFNLPKIFKDLKKKVENRNPKEHFIPWGIQNMLNLYVKDKEVFDRGIKEELLETNFNNAKKNEPNQLKKLIEIYKTFYTLYSLRGPDYDFMKKDVGEPILLKLLKEYKGTYGVDNYHDKIFKEIMKNKFKKRDNQTKQIFKLMKEKILDKGRTKQINPVSINPKTLKEY